MAVTFMTSFEARDPATDNVTFAGSTPPSYFNPAIGARTGAMSMRCTGNSGVSSYLTISTTGNYTHFGFDISTAPSVGSKLMFGQIAAGTINILLTRGVSGSFYTLDVYLNTTLIGTTAVLNVSNWYWIGVRQVTGTSVAFLQVDGVDAVIGTATVTAVSGVMGYSGTEASISTLFFDDVVVDNAGFLAPSKVDIALPTADSARTTGWVGGAGGTTNLWDAVNNTPPVGVADTGTDTSQIRNATAEASASYDATLESYSTLGVAAGDTVLAVRNVIATAAPVTTSSKQGLIGNASNPAITTIALGAGGTAGAFWSGVAGGTFPTGWKVSFGTLTTSPSVAVGTAPVMRVTQVTSSTRIAMVCFMGLLVAWTPGVPPPGPHVSPYPQILAH